MAGDYSKFSFTPAKGFSGVLQQQGRVALDSDWNEAQAVSERRARTDSLDTFGRCIVPYTTPDAFLITPTGPGAFAIGIGRAYLDGYQVECHGAPPLAFDATLAEMRGTAALDYATQQPFLPPPLPDALAGAPGTTDLVYLDVWQREVTFLEDNDLLEVALGGPDTTTRMQTVWQVRALEGVGDLDCDDPLAAYDAATLPAAARLTTSAVAPPTPDNPCIIPPTGGYRGLENRLYRVEVHTPGALGVARFKWSREAGSICFGVESLAATRDSVILHSLGRDQHSLSVQPGDWIEIIDDLRELAGLPGHMAKVGTIDPATREVTFLPAVPAAIDLDPTDPARHTRARRWDQKPVPDGDGLLGVAAGPIDLESGVRVAFSLDPAIAGGTFRTGDYWLFWARTAIADVEHLDQAPPRGIHHHYCRLGLITWGADVDTTQVEDCREHWPPDAGCCTVTVQPGESIQAAIDSLPPAGGCVCLKTGVHDIGAPIQIGRGNISLHGESPGTQVVRRNGVTLLAIGGPGQPGPITVETIDFICELDRNGNASGSPALIAVVLGTRLRFTECRAAMTGIPAEVVGLQIYSGRDIVVERCRFEAVLAGIWGLGNSLRLTVIDSLLSAPTIGDTPFGSFGIFLQALAGANLIARNRIVNYAFGVVVSGNSGGTVIESNAISRGAVLWDVAPGERIAAIDVAGPDCVVRDNRMTIGHPLHAGVHLTSMRSRVEDNRIASTLLELGSDFPVGILIEGARDNGLPADDALVVGNVLSGLMDGILATEAAGLVVQRNTLSTATAQPMRVGIAVDAGRAAVVADNHVENALLAYVLANGEANQVRDNRADTCMMGISLLQETRLQASGNDLQDASGGGIVAVALQLDAAFRGNRLRRCGYLPQLPFGFGIFVFNSAADITVESCEILDTGIPPAGDSAPGLSFGIVLLNILSTRIEANLVSYVDLASLDIGREDRALILVGPPSFVAGQGRAAFGSALVLGNKFLGAGRSALVEFMRIAVSDTIDLRFEKVTFGQNHCLHNSEQTEDPTRATVRLWGSDLIVTSNHVQAARSYPSMNFAGRTNVALIANVHTGDLVALGSSVPTPPNLFNVRL